MKMSLEDIEKLIDKYLKEHEGEVIYPSDIAEELSIDYLDVLDALREMDEVKKMMVGYSIRVRGRRRK